MELHLCMGCMEKSQENPCPNCGYDSRQTGEYPHFLPPGRILNGKYLVGKALGQGGSGITYIGYDLALELKVAIKEYYPTAYVNRQGATSTLLNWVVPAGSEDLHREGVEAVLYEARKLAKLEKIPQVVGVRDAFEENNTAYLVMDYVQGETLKSYVSRRGVMPWQEIREEFLPVMEALEKIHSLGIQHQDISPDNLMSMPDGTLRVLDLGASRDSAGAGEKDVVKHGFSPFELYSGGDGVGPWTDVYGLAATMYYALTGRIPPSALDRMAGNEINWKAPELRAVPEPVKGILKQALALAPKDRIQTMADFCKLVEQPPKQKTVPWRFLALGVATLAAVAVISVLFSGGAEEESVRETESQQSGVTQAASGEDLSERLHLTQIVAYPTNGDSYLVYEYSYTFNDQGYLATEREVNSEYSSYYISDTIYDGTAEERRDTLVTYTVSKGTDGYSEEGEVTYSSTTQYNSQGIPVLGEDWYLSGEEVSSKRIRTFDDYGTCIRAETVRYARGQPTDETELVEYTVKYDEHDNLIYSGWGDLEEGGETTYTYTYDDSGEIEKEVSEDRSWSPYWTSSRSSVSTYRDGFMVEYECNYGTGYDMGYQAFRRTFEKNDQGETIRYKEYEDGELTRTVEFDRDSEGRVLERRTIENGTVVETWEYTWTAQKDL